MTKSGSEVSARNITGRIQGWITIIHKHCSGLGLCCCISSRNRIWPKDTRIAYLRKGARVCHAKTQESPWPPASGSSLCGTYTRFCHTLQSGHSTGLFLSAPWTGNGNALTEQRNLSDLPPAHLPSETKECPSVMVTVNSNEQHVQQILLNI